MSYHVQTFHLCRLLEGVSPNLALNVVPHDRGEESRVHLLKVWWLCEQTYCCADNKHYSHTHKRVIHERDPVQDKHVICRSIVPENTIHTLVINLVYKSRLPACY